MIVWRVTVQAVTDVGAYYFETLEQAQAFYFDEQESRPDTPEAIKLETKADVVAALNDATGFGAA